MEYDKDKIDEMVLALLYLTTFKNSSEYRAWKGMDWDVMNRLHEKGYIGNPKSKAKSVALSDEGATLSEELFKKHFGLSPLSINKAIQYTRSLPLDKSNTWPYSLLQLVHLRQRAGPDT